MSSLSPWLRRLGSSLCLVIYDIFDSCSDFANVASVHCSRTLNGVVRALAKHGLLRKTNLVWWPHFLDTHRYLDINSRDYLVWFALSRGFNDAFSKYSWRLC